MKDLIERQAAIDAIQAHKHNVLDAREYDEGVACGYAAAHNHICDVIAILPSVQPEERTEERTETHACDCVDRQAAIDVLSLGKEILSRVLDDMDVVGTDREKYSWGIGLIESNIKDIEELPSAQPERKKDTIQKFHDYQIEWLKSHYDIELEPQLEEMIIRFLHDTANRYMMEEGGHG